VVKGSCPEESQIPETEILDTIQTDAANLPEVADHILPYTAMKSTDYSTLHIRKRLKLNTQGARKLTIVVFEKLEGNISDLEGMDMWTWHIKLIHVGTSFDPFIRSLPAAVMLQTIAPFGRGASNTGT